MTAPAQRGPTVPCTGCGTPLRYSGRRPPVAFGECCRARVEVDLLTVDERLAADRLAARMAPARTRQQRDVDVVLAALERLSRPR